MDPGQRGWPFGIPFVDDPFFAAALPFRAFDNFFRSSILDSVGEKSASDEHRLPQQRCPWSGDNVWNHHSSPWPGLLFGEIYEPELFAPAASPFFRKPWWRPSFWVQQRQLEQQQEQQRQQRRQQLQEQQLEMGRQQQQQGGLPVAESGSDKTAASAAAATDYEIPILFHKSKCDSSPAVGSSVSEKNRTSPHPAATEHESGAAAEEKALQLRRLKWLSDPFFSDFFSLYPPRFGAPFSQEEVSSVSKSPARSDAVPAGGATTSCSPSATTTSASSGIITNSFVPFAAPSVAPVVPTTSATRSVAGDSAADACVPYAGVMGAPLPRVDIRDCGDVLLVDAEVPGFHKENVHVSIEGKKLLRISGQQKPQQACTFQQQQQNPIQEQQYKEGRYYLQERICYPSFSRLIRLPAHVKESDVRASMSDGILHLRIPKDETPPVRSSRTIAIE